MSLNSRIIKALEPMKLKVTVSEYPVNDEEGKPQQPDTFLVIIPGTDDFPVWSLKKKQNTTITFLK